MSKMINIPAKIKNGQVVLRTNKPISIIEEGTYINISVPKHRIMYEKREHIHRGRIKLFSTDEVLLVSIDNHLKLEREKKYLSDIKNKYDLKYIGPIKYKIFYFVEIITQEDLLLDLDGLSKAKLKKCQIYIPFLEETAISVNHAYTLISTHFEKHRKSHTGNIFKMVLGNCNNQGWITLDYYRDVAIEEAITDNSDSISPLSDF